LAEHRVQLAEREATEYEEEGFNCPIADNDPLHTYITFPPLSMKRSAESASAPEEENSKDPTAEDGKEKDPSWVGWLAHALPTSTRYASTSEAVQTKEQL
jgi:hypothetical protein